MRIVVSLKMLGRLGLVGYLVIFVIDFIRKILKILVPNIILCMFPSGAIIDSSGRC